VSQEIHAETWQYGTDVMRHRGSMIPAVRDALCGRLRACGVRKTHTYFEPSASLTRDHHRLDQRLLRGATALGGASVYFDYAR
jgi:hypothetical protein